MSRRNFGKGEFDMKMKKALILAVVVLLVASAVNASLVSAGETEIKDEGLNDSIDQYEEIDPIRVDGNNDFSEKYWTGNGSEDNPYTLEGYKIDGGNEGYGIYIGNTTDYFEIRDSYVSNASGNDAEYFDNTGIYLNNVENGQLINITVLNNDGYGIQLLSEDYSPSIYNNISKTTIFRNNKTGIRLKNSHDNDLVDNSVENNTGTGISLANSNNNELAENSIENNTGTGISLDGSESNELNNNYLVENKEGFLLTDYSLSNNISGNRVVYQDNLGINLTFSSDNNNIIDNNISYNTEGINITASSENEIYLNKFIDNDIQAYDDSSDNYWDDGDPADGNNSGGNYWSDYEGTDRGDGIGNEPYVLNGSVDQDNYPWVNPYMVPWADDFNATVDNITAGQKPFINITDGTDSVGDPMNGTYEVTIQLDGTEIKEDISFTGGDAQYTWPEAITAADDYTAEVDIDGVMDTDGFTVKPGEVDSVEIVQTETQTITAGNTTELKAEAYDDYNNLITNESQDFSWVNATEGVFNKTTAGQHDVTASYQGVASEAVTITVKPADLDSVVILSEKEINTTAGDTVELEAEARDEFDNVITDTPEDFEWQNAENGTFKETNAGDYQITATYNQMTSDPVNVIVEPAEVASVEINVPGTTVVKAGEEIVLEAVAYDEYDNLVTGDADNFDWVNATGGVFNEEKTGEYKVKAIYDENHSAKITITVEPGEVTSVEINPTSDTTITAGETIDFEVEAYDGYDNLVTNSNDEFSWQNATDGVFDKTTAGEYEVIASYNGIESSATRVTVEPSDVKHVTLNPSDDQTVKSGEKISFVAEALDEYDNVITDDAEDFTWKNASKGSFEKEEVGEYKVQATYEGVTSDQVTVTVESTISIFEVTSLTVQPQEPEAGEQIEITAEIINHGDSSSEFTAELVLNGETIDTKSVSVDPDQTETVTFTHTINETGEYDVEVGGENASVDVVEDDGMPMTYVYAGIGVSILVLVIFLVFLFMKKDKSEKSLLDERKENRMKEDLDKFEEDQEKDFEVKEDV